MAARSSAHLNFCHFQFHQVTNSQWYCLHPVQHSWLNDHLVDISLPGSLLSHYFSDRSHLSRYFAGGNICRPRYSMPLTLGRVGISLHLVSFLHIPCSVTKIPSTPCYLFYMLSTYGTDQTHITLHIIIDCIFINSRTPVERPPSPTTIPLIRPHKCDSEGGRIRGVLLYLQLQGNMAQVDEWGKLTNSTYWLNWENTLYRDIFPVPYVHMRCTLHVYICYSVKP